MSDPESAGTGENAPLVRYSRALLVALSRSPLVEKPEGMPSVESYMSKPEPRDENTKPRGSGDKMLLAPAKQSFPSSQVSTGSREDEPGALSGKSPHKASLTSARKSDGAEREREGGSVTRGPSTGRAGLAALSTGRNGTTGAFRREGDKEGTSSTTPRVNGARLVDRPGQPRGPTSPGGPGGAWSATSPSGTFTVRALPTPVSADGITKLGPIKVLSTTTTPASSTRSNWRSDGGESAREKLSRSAPERADPHSGDRRRVKDSTPEWMNDDVNTVKEAQRPMEDGFQIFKAKLKEMERQEKANSAPAKDAATKVPEKKTTRSTVNPKEDVKSPGKASKGVEISESASKGQGQTGKDQVTTKKQVEIPRSEPPPAAATPDSERSSVAADRTSVGGRGSRFQRFFGGEEGEDSQKQPTVDTPSLPTVRAGYESSPPAPVQSRAVVTSPGQPLTEEELLAALSGTNKRGSPASTGLDTRSSNMPHHAGQSIDILALLGSGPIRSHEDQQPPALGDRIIRESAPQQMLSEEEVLRRLTAQAAARRTPKMTEMLADRSPPLEERQDMDRIMAMLARTNMTSPSGGFPNEFPPGMPLSGVRDPNRASFQQQFAMQMQQQPGMLPNPQYSPPSSSIPMPGQMTPNTRMRLQGDPPFAAHMKGPAGGAGGFMQGSPQPKGLRQGPPLFSSHIARQQQQQFDGVDPLAAMVQSSINAKKSHAQGPTGPIPADLQNMVKQGLLNPADLQNAGLMFPPPGGLEASRFEPNGPGALPPFSGLPPNHPLLTNDPVAFAAFAAAAASQGGNGLPPHLMQPGGAGPMPPPGFFGGGNGMPPPPHMGPPPHLGHPGGPPPPPGFFNPMFGMPGPAQGGQHLFGGRGGR